jgi:hypothetical protein
MDTALPLYLLMVAAVFVSAGLYYNLRLKYWIGYLLVINGAFLILSGIFTASNIIYPLDERGHGHQPWMRHMYPDVTMDDRQISDWQRAIKEQEEYDQDYAGNLDHTPLADLLPRVSLVTSYLGHGVTIKEAHDGKISEIISLSDLMDTAFRRALHQLPDIPLPILIFGALFGGALLCLQGAWILEKRFLPGDIKDFDALEARYPVLKGFGNICKSDLIPWLEQQDGLRRRVLWKRWAAYIVGIPLTLFFIFSIPLLGSLTSVIVIISGLATYTIAEKDYQAFKSDIRKAIAERLSSLLKLQYDAGGVYRQTPPAFDDIGIFPASTHVLAEDTFAGDYKRIGFSIGKIRFKSFTRAAGRNISLWVFNGAVIRLNFPDAFKGHTRLLQDRGMILNTLRSAVNRSQHRIRLGRADVERVFEGFSTDDNEARQLLAPAIIESMAKTAEALSGEYTVQAAFKGFSALIAVDGAEMFFDIDMWTHMANPARICHFAECIAVVYELIDTVEKEPALSPLPAASPTISKPAIVQGPEMTLRSLAEQAVQEASLWEKRNPTYGISYFIEGLHKLAASADDMPLFCNIYDLLVRWYIDSGPSNDSSFCPSFSAIGKAVDKWKKHSSH